MKNPRTKAPKKSQQICVTYRPEDSTAPRPSLDALWKAVGAYSVVAAGKTSSAQEEAMLQLLKEAVMASRLTYPRLSVEVLQDGREMFTW